MKVVCEEVGEGAIEPVAEEFEIKRERMEEMRKWKERYSYSYLNGFLHESRRKKVPKNSDFGNVKYYACLEGFLVEHSAASSHSRLASRAVLL